MGVKLIRIDERLVHGQVITSWSKLYGINKIVVVDDDIAGDPFMSQVITLSAQAGMEILILEVIKAIDYLQDTSTTGNIMLLAKSPKAILQMIKGGYVFQDVNLGNLSSSPKRKRMSKNVSLSEEEIEIVKAIVASGANVYLQMLPGDPQINISSVL
ncbi:MAG: PTS sugar transporter subunit IIB [Anaerolineaceae bacterium]|nr:PTS sugar transporter subunit IIB [Anaerolineaceae bacterium]